jgi:ATP-dependent DNA helicase RecQ
MERYSASYSNLISNFVIQNIKDNDIVSDAYYGIYCVLKNILLRGTTTPPSQFLIQTLGTFEVKNEYKYVLISDDFPVWVNTIKGEERAGDNPALHFYNELIPIYFGDYAFVKQLMLPEVPISDIIPNANLEFYDQIVDFYIPQAKLVIEIDGSQHKEEVQKAKDKQRDALFYKHGINTVRIDTAYINYEINNFSRKINEIIEVFENSPEIQVYKRAYEVRVYKLAQNEPLC